MPSTDAIQKCCVYFLAVTYFCILVLSLWTSKYSIIPYVSKYVANITTKPRSLINRLQLHSKPTESYLKSDKRGYVALVYSGTARSFSGNFLSHIVNLMAGCPYTVHLFLHTYTNDNRFSQDVNHSDYASYLSVNTTLEYYKGYVNLDNEQVLFQNIVKANVFEYLPLTALRDNYKDTYNISINRFPGHPPIPSIYYMWHSQLRSEELRQKYITASGIDYKWTFRMRHDAAYYTNWWQRAFNIQVYNSSNPIHQRMKEDVTSDWAIRPTLLYDMIYEPRLRADNILYVPFGWSYGGYNDQFAAMSSVNAKHYFTRILHVRRMLNEEKVHSETSIRLVARWNNMTVNNVDGTICYEIVRASLEPSLQLMQSDQRYQSCSYKGSGKEDCKLLCPVLKKINNALHEMFPHDSTLIRRGIKIDDDKIKSLLIKYLSVINLNRTLQIHYNDSSFYYVHLYVISRYANDPCLITTWTADQTRNYPLQYLPFILRTRERNKVEMYKRYLTCGVLDII
ncbi:unnamed protein product [Rotaria socialis]|uniref:Uncharacterized protein n=1 Tax=Rotaria socialis TaxID=392032 RepID=A0A821UVD7_9BILA|nr:unnamed protein product [Rotaria socialis]CAF4897070.1 unnamed protein product [Rotaria socialis]